METTKTNTKGRVKHLFPRKELYHVFIHSEEYAYSPANRHRISCKGNYLVVGDIGKKADIETIEEMWGFNSNRMIAIIDRFTKRIMINVTYDYHLYDLEDAIPDNYTIFYTDNPIPNKNILHNTKDCCRIYAEYLLREFPQREIKQFYSVLYNNSKVLHRDISTKNYGSFYYRIIKFIEKFNIKKYDFYNECFDAKYKLKFYDERGFFKNGIEIKLPTLKQLYTNTFFTKKEKLLLEQRYFWIKYCKGNGISFKDVINYWNVNVSIDEMIYYFNKNKYLNVNADWFLLEHTWNEYVIKCVEVNNKIIDNIIKDNIDKSNKNYREALDNLNDINTFLIDDWREYKSTSDVKVSYKKYIPPKTRNKRGQWIDAYISNYNPNAFKYIQLRLTRDKIGIETSEHAIVSLEAGISMYKLFKRTINTTPGISFDFSDKNIKVGIYNLRFIKYKEKPNSNGNKDWLIQIGCHSIWLNEVEEFIKYYHLEDKFNTNNTNTNNFKIKMK